MTIITPLARPENLPKICESIQFDKITKWLIVYADFLPFHKKFDHPKIEEVQNEVSSQPFGFQSRNLGLNLTKAGMVCFLDDDSIIHPNFWKHGFPDGYFYSFDCQAGEKVISGEKIVRGVVDLGQFVFDRKLLGKRRFKVVPALRNADGLFCVKLNETYSDKHIYVNDTASYYNFLR